MAADPHPPGPLQRGGWRTEILLFREEPAKLGGKKIERPMLRGKGRVEDRILGPDLPRPRSRKKKAAASGTGDSRSS